MNPFASEILKKPALVSAEECLRRERAAEYKHEY